MAYRQLNNTVGIGSFIFTDTSLSASAEGKALKLDSTTPGGVKLAGAGETVVGIIGDSILYQNGDPIAVYGITGQIVDALAGSAGFSAGDLVKAAASGTVITAGSTDPYFAQALDTATSGNLGRVVILGGGSIATNTTWTKSSTNLQPTTAGDAITTGPAASTAKTLSIATNTVQALGTDSAIDIIFNPKSTGVIKMTNGSVTAKPVLTAWVQGQATTGTSGTAGQVSAVGLTSSGVVSVTLAEDPGTALVLSDVVAGTDYFTVYTKNTSTDARAALSGKKVNYVIWSY